MELKRNIKSFVGARRGFSSIQTVIVFAMLITLLGSAIRIYSLTLKSASELQDKAQLQVDLHNASVFIDLAVEKELARIFSAARQRLNGAEALPEEQNKLDRFLGYFVDELQKNNSSSGHKLIYDNIREELLSSDEIQKSLGIEIVLENIWPHQFNHKKNYFEDKVQFAHISPKELKSSSDLMLRVKVDIRVGGRQLDCRRDFFLSFDQEVLEDKPFVAEENLIAGEWLYAIRK